MHDEIQKVIANSYSNYLGGNLYLFGLFTKIDNLYVEMFELFYDTNITNHIDNCLDNNLSQKQSIESMVDGVINNELFENKLKGFKLDHIKINNIINVYNDVLINLPEEKCLIERKDIKLLNDYYYVKTVYSKLIESLNKIKGGEKQ